MEDISSPTHAFLDFDFSEFIDKNFDMSNDIFNSPNTKLSSSPSLLSASHTLDDFLSCSDSGSEQSKINTVTNDNYTHESPSFSLWSNIEELAFENNGLTILEEHKAPSNRVTAEDPPSLSCIDDFIKDPHSDLVQLVQQCNTEQSLFQNLITHSFGEHLSVTPHQVLEQQQFAQQELMLQQEQQQRLLYQQQQQHHQQLLNLHQRQNFSAQLPPQHQPQHPLDTQPHHLRNSQLQQSQHLHQIQQQQQQAPPHPPQQQQRKRKSNNAGSAQQSQSQSQQNKRVSKSSSYSSNNSSYTHSDSVNAQLLRELIRQAGRNNTDNMRNNSIDSNCSRSTSSSSSNLVFPPDYNRMPTTVASNKESHYYMPMNGNYQSQQLYRHHPYYSTSVVPPPPSSISSSATTASSPASTHSSRHNLPYHIQTNTKKIPKNNKQNIQKNLSNQHRPSSSKHHPMGKPSMYSSDISQAQLLEIQAISRAQQDFIRAREQQEAEKEMMMKHQKKQQQGI